MGRIATHFRAVLFVCAAALPLGQPGLAAEPLDRLYAELADPANAEWQRTQADILREWSRSGSPAMDLLLKRGKDAIEAGDLAAAIEHLTALTDHAPDFAEGWNARATAFYLAGQIGPSVSDIGRALALNEHHFGALDGLGMILEELGENAAAMKAYRASLAIHPHQQTIHEALDRLEKKTTGTAL
jgi:tetratricopeptide (TPR) repeat protein